MAQLIDGKVISAKVRSEVAAKVAAFKAEVGVVPGLTVVRVGEDPASETYVRSKEKGALETGMNGKQIHLAATTTQAELLETVRALNADPSVHGILVQLPLPKGIDPDVVIATIDPRKDVDGFHPVSTGNLWIGRPALAPCTPAGVMRMLQEIGFDPKGKRAVVVGRSNIVGKPMAAMLVKADATVTICHSRTVDLPGEIARADLLIAAIGKAKMIRGEWIKEGAVVIDVGMNRDENGKLCGDVDFAEASKRASAITPVPGGVGLMTVAMLLSNAFDAAKAIATR